MSSNLLLVNSLKRFKQEFEPIFERFLKNLHFESVVDDEFLNDLLKTN